jgi:transcriptional regulator with XRE-family HTH domain
MGKVLAWKPRTFTSAEALLEEVQELIHADKRTFTVLASAANVSPSTINNIASGKTRWPRQTTLFPLLAALGYQLRIEKGNDN